MEKKTAMKTMYLLYTTTTSGMARTTAAMRATSATMTPRG